MKAIILALGLPLLLLSGAAQSSNIPGLTIDLSSQAIEALDNGVKLEFNARYARLKSLGLLHYRKMLQTHRFELQRHALSNRYIVKRDDLETPRIFRSINDSLNFIAAETAVLLEFYYAGDETIQVRVQLDHYALPGPMRLNAFIFDAWDIDTGWIDANLSGAAR